MSNPRAEGELHGLLGLDRLEAAALRNAKKFIDQAKEERAAKELALQILRSARDADAPDVAGFPARGEVARLLESIRDAIDILE